MSATSSTRPIREKIFKLLSESLQGEVKKERPYRVAYSTDASIFEVEPLLVVVPKNKWDVMHTVKIASDHSVSVTPRGAATGTTGGALGSGIIIDLSKYMRSFHFGGKSVTCDAGVVQDDLNRGLGFYGLRLGPETSSGNRATLGGMFACNAAGSGSPKFGTTADHVISCEMVLSDGSLVQFGPLTELELQEKCALKTLEGQIYRKAVELKKQNLQFPQLPRRVSGYSLDRLQEKPFNLAKVLAGSEGTLGIVTEIEMDVVKVLPQTHLELHFFHSMREAFAAIPQLLQEPFLSMEMIDENIIDAAKHSFIAKHHLNWIKPDARSVIYLEKEGAGDRNLSDSVLLVRKKGLELLLSRRGYTRAVGFLEDISFPPEKSLQFYDQFLTLFKGIPDIGIYGHVGAGCVHLRPFIDLRTDRKKMLELMKQATGVLKSLGGSLSGEHGDGMVRSWLNKDLYGEEIYSAFRAFKKTFDPKGILNPGKIVSTRFPEEHVRSTPSKEVSTFLDFSEEGGLALSADLCNGNGLCRKKEGLMCPSFQATHDEFDTTRARAQMLREVINHGKGNLGDKDLKKILDLCLECKGCKTECPSSVDMAKMKAEVLYHQSKSIRDYLTANVANLWYFGSRFPALFNKIQKQLGYPQLAQNRFQEHPKGNIVLFNDTYTQFINPHLGKSASALLRTVGLEAIVPPWACCGRPLYSKGFLKQAKQRIEKTVDQLFPLAQEYDILVLEPSCHSMLHEDLFGLLGHHHEKAKLVSSKVQLIDPFLSDKLPPLDDPEEFILIHTHCHQKASEEKMATYHLLKKLGNWKVKEAASGCCGMAGSFGYEHPKISKKILNLSLMPAIQENRYTSLIANGFSCRTQVANSNPEHVVEFLARKYVKNYNFGENESA